MFKKYQLKNGMNVLLIESKKSPVLSIQMWVRTGSADERKGEEGISHFIEHLVFKGSRSYGVGEIASSVEASGGELNAYTSFDQTVFYVTISKEFESVGLKVISEMMGFPTFDPKEIDNEREVVIEEIKRTNDSPHRQASRQLFSTLYKKHPYGIPVIGYPENIRKVTKKQILDYYHARYNPKNMTLIVAGDLTQKELKPKIQKMFGEFHKQKLRVVKRAQEKPIAKPQFAVSQAPFEETMVHLTWPTPKAAHKDIAALEVLALILGQGDSSRLNENLRIRNHLVNYAGSSLFASKDPGFFAISMSLNAKDVQKALAEVCVELEKILKEPPTAAELAKAVTNLASEQFYFLETVDGLARKYGNYEDLFRDPHYFEKFMKQVQALKPQDILKVARTYLTPKNLTICAMSPSEAQEIETKAKLWQKTYKGHFEKAVKAKVAPTKVHKSKGPTFRIKPGKVGEAELIKMPNGASLIIRPSLETPVVSMRCANLGGSRMENTATQGATELLSRTWLAGAGPYSELELGQKVDDMAASLSAFGGRNTVGLSMTCLSPFLEKMTDLFFLSLQEPKFESGAITREIKAMEEQFKMRKDNPAQICMLEFMKSMFGDHPYGRDPIGDEKSLSRLSGASAKGLWSSCVSPHKLVIVASGAFEKSEIKDMVESRLKKWKGAPKDFPQFPLKYPFQNQRVYTESKKEQSHVVFGFPGLSLRDPQRYTLQVIQAILAGQGGRLFLELRDKASLAYSVSPMRMEGIEGGYFGAYIGCSPEKAKTAIDMLQIEFEKLVKKEVGAEELARAQRYLIGKHDIDLQKNSNISSALLFDHIYGIDFKETYHYSEKIRAVNASAVKALAHKIFSQPYTISVVGQTAPW
jgi:zinc protease